MVEKRGLVRMNFDRILIGTVANGLLESNLKKIILDIYISFWYLRALGVGLVGERG